MKKIIYFLVLLAGFSAMAQVKIGSNPTVLGTSSVLELESANKALLITRVPSVASVASPINGMVVYDISMKCVRGYANNAWTDCNFKGTQPACPTPSSLAVASSAGNSILAGNSTSFSLSGSNISSSSWSISPTTGVSATSGTGSPTGSISFSTAGTYTITYVASSTGSCTTTTTNATAVLTVTSPTPPCPTPSGLAVASSNGATLNVGNANTFTLSGSNISSATWSISPTTGVSTTSGTGLSTGSITFATAGTYTITYIASSTGACSTTTANATATITVSATPPCPTPSGLAVASSGGGSVATGGSTSFSLTGSNISSSSWSISPTTGVSVTSGTGTPTGNITFSTAGTYTITYIASSTGSCSTTTANATASLTVSAIAPCPTPSSLAVASSGGSSIATGGSTSFSLTGSNISSSTWSISPTTGVSVTSGTGSPTGNITFSSSGTYTITYVASATGACTTTTANATAIITVNTAASGISCLTTGRVLTGVYRDGVSATGITQTIQVSVVTAGAYSAINVPAVNGVSWSAPAGNLIAGTNTITLTATGTPPAGIYGVFTYTMPAPFGCVFTESTCGAFIASGVYRSFLCHNLGANNTTLDPNVPVYDIAGDYYEWGGSVAIADEATPPGAIAGWNIFLVNPSTAWVDNGKTSNDPCPAGWRVPTKANWDGVIANNTKSFQGVWDSTGLNSTNFNCAVSYGPNASIKSLTLPANGQRHYADGVLEFRAQFGRYHSSTSTPAQAYLFVTGQSLELTGFHNRGNASSIRCIQDQGTSSFSVSCVGAVSGGTGIYRPGFPATATQIMQVNVTTPVYYDAIVTPTVNGVYWTAPAGTLINGDNNITLTASGTPTAGIYATFTYTLPAPFNCTFTVSSCGAFVSAGVYKNMMCHNLGADTNVDPHVASFGLAGNYYQWGSTAVVATSSTPAGAIAGWTFNLKSDGSWQNASKTANDPCPVGFRVPTLVTFNGAGMNSNNTITRQGSFVNDGNYLSVIHIGSDLTLPANGSRNPFDGILNSGGSKGFYWLTDPQAPNNSSYETEFSSTTLFSTIASRSTGGAIRCVKE